MAKMSPHDILRHHGKWIARADFLKLVAEKNDVTERQAQRQINIEFEERKLRKQVFSDRTVIYGLDEFGPPTVNATTQVFQIKRARLGFFEWWEKRALRRDFKRWSESKNRMVPVLASFRKRAGEGSELYRRIVEEQDALDAKMEKKFKELL